MRDLVGEMGEGVVYGVAHAVPATDGHDRYGQRSGGSPSDGCRVVVMAAVVAQGGGEASGVGVGGDIAVDDVGVKPGRPGALDQECAVQRVLASGDEAL